MFGCKTGISLAQLFNLQGKHVAELVFQSQGTINLTGLPAGIYLLKLSQENAVSSYKFVKAN
jgi:hypothetical protein